MSAWSFPRIACEIPGIFSCWDASSDASLEVEEKSQSEHTRYLSSYSWVIFISIIYLWIYNFACISSSDEGSSLPLKLLWQPSLYQIPNLVNKTLDMSLNSPTFKMLAIFSTLDNINYSLFKLFQIYLVWSDKLFYQLLRKTKVGTWIYD